jgi:amylosucrase
MGDELGMLNDRSYLDDPAKAADNRWIHRPGMDWSVAEGHAGSGSIADRVFAAITRLIEARRSLPALHASVATDVFTASNPAVLVFRRRHAAGSIVQVYNLSESPQWFESSVLWPLDGLSWHDHLSGDDIAQAEALLIPPYGSWWLTSQ